MYEKARLELSGASPGQLQPQRSGEYSNATCGENCTASDTACFYPTDIHSGSLGEGRHDDSLARVADLKAELLFVSGQQDPHVPFAGRETIRATLEGAGARYEWHEVNAAHAFLRDEGLPYDPALFVEATGWLFSLFRRTLQA